MRCDLAGLEALSIGTTYLMLARHMEMPQKSRVFLRLHEASGMAFQKIDYLAIAFQLGVLTEV